MNGKTKCKTHISTTFPKELAFVYHQYVENYLKYADFEDLRGGLDLAQEELERVCSHTLVN